MSASHPYCGACAVLTTMHGKAAAIAPPLQRALGLIVESSIDLDTDRLGTFSGEIPRIGTMGEVAIKKARMGMEATGLKLGLASEGTFGPHPYVPFVSAGMELIMLVDDERGFTVSESYTTERTNFAHAVASGIDGLGAFLGRTMFPTHGLIVEAHKPENHAPIFKGIVDRTALAQAVVFCARASADGQALIQTDMRAHMNPTRMASLRELAERLAARLSALCPACQTPGFGRTSVETGLPCSACGTATDLVLTEVFGCSVCDYKERRPRADGLEYTEPTYCPACNP